MQFTTSVAAALMAATAFAAPIIEKRDTCSGPGVLIVNSRSASATFNLYQNDQNGYASFAFDSPYSSQDVAAGASKFVSLPDTWKGRVQRGNEIPSTWAEFQVKDESSIYHDGKAHGDISLQQGTDGAATIAAGDGSSSNGFDFDIVTDAPDSIIFPKTQSKERAIVSTMGNYVEGMQGYRQDAVDYIYSKGLQGKVYADKSNTGVPDVASADNCMIVTFY